MFYNSKISGIEFRRLIRRQTIVLGGNSKLKIYGSLTCAIGRRMKREHRVFFEAESEALAEGYRPCGHCIKAAYAQWKNDLEGKDGINPHTGIPVILRSERKSPENPSEESRNQLRRGY